MFYKRSLGYKHYYSKGWVLSVRFSPPMGRFIARFNPETKERTLNRIPVFMKVIPGIIRSMYHMMYMAWRN